jgi:cation diffusion facilitator CzcD-associated flavoprotein CzcO
LGLAGLTLLVALPVYAGPAPQPIADGDRPAALNRPTMEALHADIDACRATGCSLAPHDVERMAWWVARGNRLAIRLSFAAADLVGDDGARALARGYGQIIKQDPAAFLAMARDEGTPATVIGADAAATPDLVAGAQADELRARRNALRSVTDPSLADLRDQCLADIAGRLAALAPKLARAGT